MLHRRHTVTWIAIAVCGVLASRHAAGAAPGDPDPSFGTGGDVTTPIPGAAVSVASAIVRLPDGRLLTAGTTGSGATHEVVLVQYLTDGTPDPAFGAGGVRRPLPGLAVVQGGVSLARHGDGRLVVAATLIDGAERDVLVARLDALGTLDPAFGDGGIRVVDVASDDRAAAVVVDPSGRPVVAGEAGGQVLVVRLTSSGAPDPAFDGDGVARTDATGAGLASAAHDVALEPDGKIVVAGEASNGDDLDLALVRYDDAGTPDPTFGSGGVVVTPVSEGVPFGPPADDSARAVLLDPGGAIVVAGRTRAALHGALVARYDASGTLDPSFDGDGVVVVGELGEGSQAFDVVREPNGRLVVAGLILANEAIAVHGMLLVRLEPDGTPDASFGDAGLVMHSQSGSLFPHDAARALVRDSAGRYVAAGYSDATFFPWNATSIALSRFLGDGQCGAGSSAGCIRSRAPGREILRVHDPVSGAPRLAWRLPGLPSTTLEDFGDPRADVGYELCVFDATGQPLVDVTVPAGAMCGARPCWRRLPTGFDYRDGARAEGGLARIQLRPGADGRARVLLDASGPALDVPPLPLETPVTVELRTTSDVCWQGVYGADGVRRNDAGSFVGRGTLE